MDTTVPASPEAPRERLKGLFTRGWFPRKRGRIAHVKTTKRAHQAERARLLLGILLVVGATVLSARMIGMRRHSRSTAPPEAVQVSEMELREQLLKDLPVTDRRLGLAGVSTSVLEGGEGTPIVLLHGQGGFAEMWGRVIPRLVESHRVVAPDLPGLGQSEVQTGRLDTPRVVAWLGDLIAQTCAEPPILVGHSLGGSIAAHFAIEHGERVRRIVLVDSGSLGRFRPAPPVIVALLQFSARPSSVSHGRFLRQVFDDPERARAGWGKHWAAFEAYHIDRAGQPSVGAANRDLLRRMGVRRILPDQFQKIGVPVALIWGRNDPIMRFRIAEAASAQFGWPLYPIDDCGHVPHVERPEVFLDALNAATADV